MLPPYPSFPFLIHSLLHSIELDFLSHKLNIRPPSPGGGEGTCMFACYEKQNLTIPKLKHSSISKHACLRSTVSRKMNLWYKPLARYIGILNCWKPYNLKVFTSLATECSYDYVFVYDGANSSTRLIGSFSGETLPGNQWCIKFLIPPCTGGGGGLSSLLGKNIKL